MEYENVRPTKFYIGGERISEIKNRDMTPYEESMHNVALMIAMMFGVREERTIPQITKVIFNKPATIVFWSDGTKTVVQAQDEAFDKEKGLAMAIAKKAMGNRGNYFDEFKKWIREDA